jgi:hypothetical protein
MDTMHSAVLTVRRAIEERFPPGPEGEAWLNWLREAAVLRGAPPDPLRSATSVAGGTPRGRAVFLDTMKSRT